MPTVRGSKATLTPVPKMPFEETPTQLDKIMLNKILKLISNKGYNINNIDNREDGLLKEFIEDAMSNKINDMNLIEFLESEKYGLYKKFDCKNLIKSKILDTFTFKINIINNVINKQYGIKIKVLTKGKDSNKSYYLSTNNMWDNLPNKILPKENTALGGDDRTGVSALVTMLKTLFKENIPHGPITVLFTVREESGLWGARKANKEDLGNPVRGYNIDGGPAEEIVTGAVGCDRWEAEIFGKAEHAGLAPEKGLSASMIASLALSDAKNKGWFGKVSKENKTGTSNIGIFGGKNGKSAGASPNTVCEYAHIKGESRSYDQDFV